MTKREFIERSKLYHWDKYDYSMVDFKGVNHKVTIICPNCGPFEQLARNHAAGNGCSRCRSYYKGADRLTTSEFIRKAIAKHGYDRYDYSQVRYHNSVTKVTIICKEHGPFSIRPNNHLSGSGCSECRRFSRLDGRRHSKATFIKRAIAKHGRAYTYDDVIYVNNHTKVNIRCRDHGLFSQTPQSHIDQGSGCPQCAIRASKLPADEYFRQARRRHNDLYDYSESAYISMARSITFYCYDHDKDVTMRAVDHLNGKQCPDCAKGLPEVL